MRIETPGLKGALAFPWPLQYSILSRIKLIQLSTSAAAWVAHPAARESEGQLHDLHDGEPAPGIGTVGETEIGNPREYPDGHLWRGEERAAGILVDLQLAVAPLGQLLTVLVHDDRIHVRGWKKICELELDGLRRMEKGTGKKKDREPDLRAPLFCFSSCCLPFKVYTPHWARPPAPR